MPAKNTAAAAALADAFAALTVEGKPVTVWTLRERARVSTDAGSERLRTNRPARDVSPVPGRRAGIGARPAVVRCRSPLPATSRPKPMP